MLAQNDVRESQRQIAFGTRPRRNPFVRISSRLRHSWFDLHEFPAVTGASLPHIAVGESVGHRGVPRAEKIGAKRDYVIRMSQIERRQLVISEAQVICPAQDGIIKQLKFDKT